MQMISEVMTRNVRVVSPQDTLQHTAQLMSELDVGALPVCDGERLLGMVTDRDITIRATAAGMAPQDTNVEQVMTKDVQWVFEDEALDEVTSRMADSQIRRVPVVSHDNHKLVGIVALGDLATKAQGFREVTEVVESVSTPSDGAQTNRMSMQSGQQGSKSGQQQGGNMQSGNNMQGGGGNDQMQGRKEQMGGQQGSMQSGQQGSQQSGQRGSQQSGQQGSQQSGQRGSQQSGQQGSQQSGQRGSQQSGQQGSQQSGRQGSQQSEQQESMQSGQQGSQQSGRPGSGQSGRNQ